MGRIYIVTSTSLSAIEELLEMTANFPLQKPLQQLENASFYLNVTTAHREARERAKTISGSVWHVLRLETLAQHPGVIRHTKTTRRLRKIS